MAPSAEEEVTRFLHPWSYPTGVQMYLWNECTLTFTSRSLEVFFFPFTTTNCQNKGTSYIEPFLRAWK